MRRLWSGVYPRVCGGAPGIEQVPDARLGSIPACAGEPDTGERRGDRQKVYPRVCGGALTILTQGVAFRGLSPRVRGSHRAGRTDRKPPGSIPACAGEPLSNY